MTIANLLAIHQQKAVQVSKRSRKIKTTNAKSGVRGVFWDNTAQKWRAVKYVKGERVYLGCFKTVASAAKARADADIKYNVQSTEVSQ